MRKGLRVAGPGLAVIVFSLLPFGAMAGAGRSPREALTPRVGREVPRPVPYRVFRAGSPSEASRALRPGERALLVLDDVGPRWYGRPVDELAEKLDAAVAAASGAKPHALVLGLANVPWGGGLETLNALYRHLKARWGIPVFQSYASPLPPHPAQLADGWVVAPRGLSGEEVRRYLVKFLVTGKPVLRLEAPAAEGPEAVPLLALCQRLAVPASFLSAAGCLQIQSRQAPRPRPDDVAYDLSELWQNLPDEADTLVAAPVQMGGDRVKRFDYCDPFRQEWFLDDATVVGVSRLRWPGPQGLKVVGKAPRRKVSLTYHFVGPWETRELVVELAGCVRGKGADFVELALSLDGKRFMHPARAYARAEGNPFHLTSVSNYRFDRESFWVRVTADLSPGSEAVLERFRVNCRVKPPGLHVVDLSPSRDGRLRYLEEFVSRWTRGGLFLPGRQPVQVHIRQRFQSSEPLSRIIVRVHNAVLGPDGAVANSFAISTDGSTPIASATVRPRQGGWLGVTELRVESPALLAASPNGFYLHITLANSAGGAEAPSNILGAIEVEAVPASTATHLAAR